MNTLRIRNIHIGSGIPKICVPIVSKTKNEILDEAKNINTLCTDLVEWRVDYFEDVFEIEKVKITLFEIRTILGEIPIIFTFRTKNEGGEKAIEASYYLKLNSEIAKTKNADLIDVEAFFGDYTVKEIIKKSHDYDVRIIASNHDFLKTPPKDEIISRLKMMQDLGADILKIAVMPVHNEDVLTLLSATQDMVSKYAHRPVIAVSMSGKGLVSRVFGEFFGSAVTFGSSKEASAPGQINACELQSMLGMIHNKL
ncbi:MAG: type I 3-dehydroquinate dehydratase [Proteocatella sp.]